jgi:hypothetical protein
VSEVTTPRPGGRPEASRARMDAGHTRSGHEHPGGPCRLLRVRSRGWTPPSGDWRRGSALPSHGRGHWFDPSIAHDGILGSRSRGRSSVGRASPCQGEGRRFESGRPLRGRRPRRRSGAASRMMREHLRWVGRVVRQRPAKPCTRVRIPYPPPPALHASVRAIGAAVARFPDTEEVTGSIPVSPTITKEPRPPAGAPSSSPARVSSGTLPARPPAARPAPGPRAGRRDRWPLPAPVRPPGPGGPGGRPPSSPPRPG